MTKATAEIELSASPNRLIAGLRAGLKAVQGFVHQTTGLLNPNKSKRPDVGSIALGAGIGGVVSALAVRGMDKMVALGQEVFDFERELIRFGIAARRTPAEMRAMGNAARKTSSEIGVNALEVLRAGKAYVDLAGAENFSIDMMNVLARSAQASGAASSDLAGMMYQLKVSMKVPDNQMEDAIGGLINQAKDGAIEAKQMATEFAAILPLFARFGVTGREGAVQAGALFQVMRNGANTAAEAGTMIQRVYAGIQSYAPRFEAQGIKIYESFRDPLGRKVLRPFASIFKDITNSKAMQDPAVVKKMFGRTEGWRGLLLGDEAARAMTKAGGSVDGMISKLAALEEAGRANGVVQQDLATFTESTAGRMDIAIERMKNAFAEALTPERIDQIVSGIQKIADAMPAIMHAVGAASDAFAGFLHIVARAKHALQGQGHYRFQESESEVLRAADVRRNDKGLQEQAAALRSKKAAYDSAMDAIMGKESDFGPTDESIKTALRYRHAGAMGDATPEQVRAARAASNYLADRGSEIQDSRIERIREELRKEFGAAEAARQKDINAMADAMKIALVEVVKDPSFLKPKAPAFMSVTFDANSGGKAIDDGSRGRRK